MGSVLVPRGAGGPRSGPRCLMVGVCGMLHTYIPQIQGLRMPERSRHLGEGSPGVILWLWIGVCKYNNKVIALYGYSTSKLFMLRRIQSVCSSSPIVLGRLVSLVALWNSE